MWSRKKIYCIAHDNCRNEYQEDSDSEVPVDDFRQHPDLDSVSDSDSDSDQSDRDELDTHHHEEVPLVSSSDLVVD